MTLITSARPVASQNELPDTTQQTPIAAQYSIADMTEKGTEQGITVARATAGQSDVDFQGYTHSVISQMQALGFSTDQINAYTTSMISEYNALTPTASLDANYSYVGNGILSIILPASQDPPTALHAGLQTLANFGTTLGQQLAAVMDTNTSNFDIAAYGQNIAEQMQKRGYSSDEVDAFTSGLLMGYFSALGGYISEGA